MTADLFPNSLPLNPAAPESDRADFAAIPAKPAVYLLTAPGENGAETPILLATVGDLRATLKRRLADNPPDIKSKRVAYGSLCTTLYYRPVHSLLGANFHYAAAARALFLETASALIPWRTSWWIAVERHLPAATPHPRFRKTSNLSDPALAYAGPIRDKHAANRLVESIEDLFDLCRYHNILVQAPAGKPCAYKEMGKCPAPCDGTISLATYRTQIDAALAFLTDEAAPNAPPAADAQAALSPRAAWRAKLEQQMKSAAAVLQFEAAAKIKQRLTRAGLFETEPYASTSRLEDFAFLSLQPGKGKPWIEPWIIHFAGELPIQPLPQFNFKDLSEAAQHLADQCRLLNQLPPPTCLTADQSLHAALVAHHLFRGDADHGMWLRLREAVTPQAIIHAADRLLAKKAPKPLTEQSSDIAPAGEPEEKGDAP